MTYHRPTAAERAYSDRFGYGHKPPAAIRRVASGTGGEPPLESLPEAPPVAPARRRRSTKAANKTGSKPTRPERKPNSRSRTPAAPEHAAHADSPLEEVGSVDLGSVDHGADVQVEIYDSAREAHRLLIDGVDLSEVAVKSGYASPAICKMGVEAYLQKAGLQRSPELRQKAREVEVARTDVLLAHWWERALREEKAAIIVMKLIALLAKLQGLENIADAKVGQRTIVIGGGPDMADQLKAAALAQEAEMRSRDQQIGGISDES